MISRRGLFRRFVQAGAVAAVGAVLPKQAKALSPSGGTSHILERWHREMANPQSRPILSEISEALALLKSDAIAVPPASEPRSPEEETGLATSHQEYR